MIKERHVRSLRYIFLFQQFDLFYNGDVIPWVYKAASCPSKNVGITLRWDGVHPSAVGWLIETEFKLSCPCCGN